MSWKVHLAKTEQELAEIYRFRYRIYVEEMGRTQHYTDHDAKRIVDPLDALSPYQYYALQDDEIVGVVRTNYLKAGSVGPYETLYDLPVDPRIRALTTVTTRLMLSPSLRATGLGVALAAAACADVLENYIEDDYIDCNPSLVRFFLKLGYLPVKEIDHPEYGRVHLMKIRPRDLNHMRAVNSPFVPVLEAYFQRAVS